MARKEFISDPDIIEKAASMCGYKSDAQVSDYLGMVEWQVKSIRETLGRGKGSGRPRLSFDFIDNLGSGVGQDLARQFDAVNGSQRLLDAMRRVA